MIQITREQFRTWIESARPGQTVGYARRVSCCPISKYLEQTDNRFADKGRVAYERDGGVEAVDSTGESHQLPEWCTPFVVEVDALARGAALEDYVPVSREDVLHILGEI
jgi:hypothetical protein